MEQKKKLTLLWRKLSSLEFGKDVVLVPYYLGVTLGYQVEICCGYSDDIAEQVIKEEKKNLHFVRKPLGHNPFQRIPVYMKYLISNASNINFLMCFHWRLETFINILVYRLFNKDGIIYIKLDTESGKEWDLSGRSFLSKLLRKKLYANCLKKVTLLSCETSKPYDYLRSNKDFGNILKKKLVLMPNAFDEAYLMKSKIIERSYDEKENIMITVGRLGDVQKNTEMLLKALENIDLKNWKFYLIGPVEQTLEHTIEQFYMDNPRKKNQVFFLGKIDDKKELWEWYNKAKVFVFTSRWESYGLVLNEAKRFSNYMICTRTGAAEDLIEQQKYGCFVDQNDSIGLSNIISNIINGQINTNVYADFDSKQLSYENNMKILSKFLITNT